MQANRLIRLFYVAIKVFLSTKIASMIHFPPDRQAYLGTHGDRFPPDILPQAWAYGGQSRERLDEAFKARLKERYELAATLQLDSQ